MGPTRLKTLMAGSWKAAVPTNSPHRSPRLARSGQQRSSAGEVRTAVGWTRPAGTPAPRGPPTRGSGGTTAHVRGVARAERRRGEPVGRPSDFWKSKVSFAGFRNKGFLIQNQTGLDSWSETKLTLTMGKERKCESLSHKGNINVKVVGIAELLINKGRHARDESG